MGSTHTQRGSGCLRRTVQASSVMGTATRYHRSITSTSGARVPAFCGGQATRWSLRRFSYRFAAPRQCAGHYQTMCDNRDSYEFRFVNDRPSCRS